MSEQISAFAAYNSKAPKVAASKKAGAQKPGAAKKTIASSAAAKKSANKSKSKSKTTTAKAASKPKAEPKTKTAPKAAQKPKAAPKVAPKSKAAPKATQNNKQTATPDIDLNEIDGLVDQLLLSPTSNKKLTKEQQKKKQDLEKYLIRQLEKDDEMGEEEGGSDEFSDEYTLDDSDSCSEEESETGSEGESGSDEESGSYDESCSDDESGSFEDDDDEGVKVANQPKSRKSLPAEKTQKTTVTASKRKSMDAPTAAEKEKPKSRMSAPIVANGDIAAKKAKKSNDEPYKVNGEVCKRRSKGGDAQPPAQSTPQAVHKSKVGNVKLEPLSPPSNVVKMNSITEGLKVFRWLLNPVSVETFYAKYWERSACLVKRQQANYFSHLISFEAIDQMLLKNHVEFTKNIDVTSYKNGVRETLNPDGRAMPPVVWEHYGNGCSIRLLNPQTFLPALYTLNATLQEYFHCLVGANAYLTPPNSQGFAPHYDDIEAFVLQVEGRKRWKLYKPRSKSEELPRFSSPNFKQSEIGKPILDEVLQPGDILYFPRGTIHQACTEPGYHSLHITLSVYQKQSFADLFERMIPMMLQRAIASNVDLRRGLPLNTWHHAGIAFSDNDTKERQQLVQKVSQLLTKCMRDVPITELMDSAVDQLAKKFQHEALPPEVLPSERQRTVFGSKSKTNERGECVCDYDIELRTNVRLLRANILRLVEEEQKIRIYYYLDNSKEYCEYDPNFIEIEAEEAGSVEVLIKSYPEYVGVSQLPLADDERKISVVTALWERGLLMMEKPFQ